METKTGLTREEIIEGNRLIAEFDGFLFINDNPEFLPNGYFVLNSKEGFHNQTNPDELNYHSSWDWLMPVVEKIEKINSNILFSLDTTGCTLSWDDGTEKWKFIESIINSNKIESTYQVVIEFIKWYNQQSK